MLLLRSSTFAPTAFSRSLPRAVAARLPIRQAQTLSKVSPTEQEGYQPQGFLTSLAGLGAYRVGQPHGRAVLMVHDGYAPQMLLGADLLASAGYHVVIPDFGGAPASTSILDIIWALRSEGMCMLDCVAFGDGWKALLGSGEVNQFSSIGAFSPTLTPSDATSLAVPLCLLPSGDEDVGAVEAVFAAMEEKLPGQNVLKWFDAPRGFADSGADVSLSSSARCEAGGILPGS